MELWGIFSIFFWQVITQNRVKKSTVLDQTHFIFFFGNFDYNLTLKKGRGLLPF